MVAGWYLKQYSLAGYYSKDWELDIFLVLNIVWGIFRVGFEKRQKELDSMVKIVKLRIPYLFTADSKVMSSGKTQIRNSLKLTTNVLVLSVFQLSVIVLEHLNKFSGLMDWRFPGQKSMKKLSWAEIYEKAFLGRNQVSLQHHSVQWNNIFQKGICSCFLG